MAKNEQLFELNKRLGVVISLLLRMLPKEGSPLTLRDQIKLLEDLGMRPKEIGSILGRTPSHISKELAIIRKEKKKRYEEKE